MEQIVQIYKALSEEMRLRILMLLTQGELCVCDIMAVLGEPQSKVSRHLAYLKHSGLIEGRRVGTWMHYFLKEPLGPLSSAHVELMKKELSGLDWAKTDAEKLLEVQEQKLCEQAAARQGRASPQSRNSRRGSVKDRHRPKSSS
jgi:ArsR family transcriptional regulator, arsenate/arsenite/antimonite-responsive transcriptional repressor